MGAVNPNVRVRIAPKIVKFLSIDRKTLCKQLKAKMPEFEMKCADISEEFIIEMRIMAKFKLILKERFMMLMFRKELLRVLV